MDELCKNGEFTPVDNSDTAPTSIVDRYFTRLYKLGGKKRPGEDMCILHHSNRLCVVTLAESHPILSLKKSVSSVNFQIDSKTFRLDNKVSGKNKRGAQYMKEGSGLCHVTCTDGSVYTLVPCIRGSLVEVNETLMKQPDLLTNMPSTRGYIAIIQTGLNEHQKQMDSLLSREEYERERAKRDGADDISATDSKESSQENDSHLSKVSHESHDEVNSRGRQTQSPRNSTELCEDDTETGTPAKVSRTSNEDATVT